MAGYWLYHHNKYVRRSKIMDVPPPGRWVRFVMWLMIGATWQDLSRRDKE